MSVVHQDVSAMMCANKSAICAECEKPFVWGDAGVTRDGLTIFVNGEKVRTHIAFCMKCAFEVTGGMSRDMAELIEHGTPLPVDNLEKFASYVKYIDELRNQITKEYISVYINKNRMRRVDMGQ